jgi:D-alanine-D-alanine ligase
LPGMTATSLVPQEAKAVGMDFPTLCDYLVELSLKKNN